MKQRIFRFTGENKHYAQNRAEDNDIFYQLKDWFIDKLLFKEELKEIRFGFSMHYCKIIPPIALFWRNNPKRMNFKKLVLRSKGFEMEAEQNDWESVLEGLVCNKCNLYTGVK